MGVVRRAVNCAIVLSLGNIVFLWEVPVPANLLRVVGLVVLLVLFAWVNAVPLRGAGLPRKLRSLGSGCELLLTAALCTVLQLALCLLVGLVPLHRFSGPAWIFNSVVSLLVLYILFINSAIRLFFSSAQLTLVRRVLLLCLWWVPVANLAVFFITYPVARREYLFARTRHLRNQQRQAQQVCATRYPLVLVHGIFFRDWKHLGYWGRIPEELEQNGAVVHHGHQQSSSSVATSAGELKTRIMQIVQQTGCGKVNIIAHSKGGLDARYAISCLGMNEYVASLTTVNTPHRGCRFARQALDNVPQGVVAAVTKNYNKIFTMLGDDQPDFLSGVSELTDKTCEKLNEQMPDMPGVLYRSIGSKMKTAGSAGFPLNLGFEIVNAIDGENDGLVAVGSMPWGEHTMLTPAGKRGISHADMIDLTRRDIPGFDVREVYVDLVQRLKERGL